MATTTIKGIIKNVTEPRVLKGGKWLQEFVLVEKTQYKDHEHLIQVFTPGEPTDDIRDHVGTEAECSCYVNSRSYQVNGETKYSTQLSLKYSKAIYE